MENTTVETLESIDDFLGLPGADAIATKETETKPTIFTKEVEADMSFLDEKEGEEKPGVENVEEVLAEITGENIEEDEEGNTETIKGRKKVDKSAIIDVFKAMIEEKSIIPFDDEKPLEEYTVKDFKELIEANFLEREKAIKEKTPQEFFDALPAEFQYAARYLAEGGQDLKSLFKALAQVEETKDLNPTNEQHQETITRYYLQASNFAKGNKELIDEQIEEWKEAGTLEKKAKQFKPLLDDMEKEVVEAKIAEQAEWKKTQLAIKQNYMDNIYNVLNKGEINGIKLEKKKIDFLWNELTTLKHQSRTGNPTNLLGKLLEDYQFGKEPRYDLIVEATMLLSDPEGYKESIRQKTKEEVTADTIRKLKTEEGRTKAGREIEKPEERRTLKKPTNIFKR